MLFREHASFASTESSQDATTTWTSRACPDTFAPLSCALGPSYGSMSKQQLQ